MLGGLLCFKMTDVNEEIVKAYYEAQGYLVKTNHPYNKKGPGGGFGASDIDLIIMHPKTKDKAIISVKGWHNSVVKKSNLEKKWKSRDKNKLKIDKQTLKEGKSFFGDNNFKKILIVSCIDKNDFQKLKRKLEKFYGYDVVLDFPTILRELIEGNKDRRIKDRRIQKFNHHKNYRDSEFMQTLRLLVKHHIKN